MKKIKLLFKGKVKYNTLMLMILLLFFVVLHILEYIYGFGVDTFNWLSAIIWFISEMGIYTTSIIIPDLHKIFNGSDTWYNMIHDVFPYILYALVLTLLILSWRCFVKGNIRRYESMTMFLYFLYSAKIAVELFCFLLGRAFLLHDMQYHFSKRMSLPNTLCYCLLAAGALSFAVSFLLILFGFKSTDKIKKEIKNEDK